MNLNNRGWGAREMIFLSCGLLIALSVSIFYISKLYGSIDEATSNSTYFELETELESAAIRYRNDNDINVNGTYKISYGTLKTEGYIEELKDPDDNLCGGYVIISRLDNDLNYEGYISCNDYVTDGY